MKYFAFFILGLVMIASTAFAESKELHLYNWPDYTPPKLIEKFESETGIKVTVDLYDTNETALAKLQSGNVGYDLLIPSEYMAKIMIDEGLLQKANVKDLPNWRNVSDVFIGQYWDPENEYAVPYAMGSTAFTVNTDVYDGNINTLKMLFDPPEQFKGRIALLKEPNEVIHAAMRYLDIPRCSANPAHYTKILDLLQKQKQWVKLYASDGVSERLVGGEVDLHMNWSGYSMRSRLEKPSLVYAFPKEGYTAWADVIVMPVGAKNPENAKKFMNFVMDSENAGIISDFTKYKSLIQGADKFVTDKDLLTAPELNPPPGTPEPEFVPPCPPEIVKIYDKVWTQVLR